ncbi:MAG: UPF0176 protein [Candidatus Midichloriaceae bacterium]|jgi:UPF0176 protein
MDKFYIISFYKFIKINSLITLKVDLLSFCKKNKIKGTILIAEEGINATISGDEESINLFCDFITKFDIFSDLLFKHSNSNIDPFKRMKIKLKKEIVTFRVENLDASSPGVYLDSDEWDDLIKKEDTVLIDTRNHYEYAMGTFRNAINPHINNFTELKQWLDVNFDQNDKEKNVAMFCTGGIRCEKSTSYLKQQGFKNVYHLKDGIIKYIKDRKNASDSSWNGECFIFDDRITY